MLKESNDRKMLKESNDIKMLKESNDRKMLKESNDRKMFYIGTLNNENKDNIDLTGDTEITSTHCEEVYNKPLRDLLIKTNNNGKKLNYTLGDNSLNVSPSVIVKTRGRGRDLKSGVILRCLDYGRHWDGYYNKPNDIEFDKKESKVYWRGTTTGQPTTPGNRFDLVTNYYNKYPKIDVGFSSICQGKSNYSQYVKDEVGVLTMLQNKYIISVEGNDKDSGINWKLNSNSLVLMPRPRITSWLMETTLIPEYHYILLKDDFSDLYEKYEWCEKNQEKCKEIIKNANRFMSQFANKENEIELEKEVINKYFEILNA